MAVTAQERQYILSQVNQLAQTQLNQLWAKAGSLSNTEFAAFVVSAFPQLADPFISITGQLAATWFELSAPASTYVASVAELPPVEQLTKSAEWALGATGDAGLNRLEGTLQRAVFDGSRDTTILNIQATKSRWARVAQADACAFCKLLATRTQQLYRSEESAGTQYHDHCVPGGTLASGPPTEAAYRRRYQGEAVVIDTTSGQQLTITPNHPVLTDKGWIPAGLLNCGDNVVRALASDAGAATVPHEHQKPARIEDVWRALAVDGLACVPGSTEDFHGDGLNGEVEVVGTHSQLCAGHQATFVQEPQQLLLAAAGGACPGAPLSVLGEVASLFPGTGRSTHSVLGGPRYLRAFRGAELRHPGLLGRSAVAGSDPGLQKMPADDGTLNTEAFSNLKLRQLIGDVEPPHGFNVKSDFLVTRFDPAGFEFSGQGRGVYASRGLDLLASLSGQVELDGIVEYRQVSLSDHVYNLQTENGWYAAESLVVSNCHCTPVEVRMPGDYQLPDYVQEWSDMYVKARADAGSGNPKAILSAWRKLDGSA